MKNIIQKFLWTEVLALIVLGLLLYPDAFPYAGIVRGIAAFLYILYVPGYRISYFFFNDEEVSSFERFIMGLALSLFLAICASLCLHYFQIPVYHIYIYVLTLLIILLSFFGLLFLQKRDRR